MGYLRRGFKFKMRLSPGGPLLDARWYRAPKKAKLFPHEHFANNRFVTDFRKDFGQVPGSWKWDKGENTRNTKGQCFRGAKEWFRDGLDLTGPIGAQQDPCTSCPTHGPIVGISSNSLWQSALWVGITRQGVLPYEMILKVSGSPSSDGEYPLRFGDGIVGAAWGYPSTSGGGSAQLAFEPRSDYGLLIELPSQNVIAALTAVSSFNPVYWTSTVTLPSSPWGLGTKVEVFAALVLPAWYKYRNKRLGIQFRGRRNPPTWLAIQPIGSLYVPDGGPSEFSDEFSDEF